MRLVTYHLDGGWRAGVMVEGRVVDAAAAAEAAGLAHDSAVDWTSNRHIIQVSPDRQTQLESAARTLAAANTSHAKRAVRAVDDVRLGPPIVDPEKIICLGLNYRDHAKESGLPIPSVPILFAKYRNALTGPTSPIILPGVSQEIDYEAELAVVIGRRCKSVAAAEAPDVVAGYVAFNDVSARDVQMRTSQWLAGKTLDTFGPCGPALVIDEIRDPQALSVSTRVNGETLQHGNTRDMIFSVAESIAFISQLMTLQPGDIIATGTPAGVGFKREPPIFLRHGDIVEVEIEGIGILRNPVVDPARQ
ncbi:MAG TPA: fumarylacetoacetate hydrolase family protein [Anaerolineales bacterium]|nr:fumarylacetoacetate hydrolase family protein [Anaerolineales bacterium]